MGSADVFDGCYGHVSGVIGGAFGDDSIANLFFGNV